MSPLPENQEEEDEEEEISGAGEDDEDNGFDEDMEALRRACMLTGTNPHDLVDPSSATIDSSVPDAEESSSDEDELQVLRKIRSRFSITDSFQPLSLKPLSMLPPALSDGEEDDLGTLRAIQKRFGAYDNDTLNNGKENSSKKEEHVLASSVSLEKETSFVDGIDGCKRFPDSEYDCPTSHQLGENLAMQPSASTEWHQSDPCNPSVLPPNCSSFPKSAKMFMDAIKKNRSCQRFLRSKLVQIEAKIEQNKKLKDRVKILKDFQVSCKKRTGRALSQKKDPRVLLISLKKSSASKDSKLPDKKISAMYYGPVENCQVANYRMALETFPLALDRKRWSEAEKKNLERGIRQQFQEMVLQISVDRLSDSGGSYGDLNDLDNILVSIKDLDITAENIRKFLPKVNWEQLASMYVVGRSGAECEVRWLNFEDPLINHNPWTAEEDKTLLFLVQERGISNWFDIALSLGTNRTPFQCLVRYQRSLNVSILKSEWTKDEDDKLRSAVESFGEGDWQSVASILEGRTGTQCSNRWKKSLHPTRERVGRWTPDEDKRLIVAQMLFGAKNWKKIAQFVPGRTQVQCRERWVNSLDPSLNWGKWTAEEDSNLRAAIAEHGYCWAKVSECVPRRTDNMCRRRWKVLLPQEVPLLQEARRIQKAALIRNFVDREEERPALGPKDFLPLPMITSTENVNHASTQNGKLRGCSNSTKKKSLPSCKVLKKRSKKSSNKVRICPEEVLEVNNSDGGHEPTLKKKTRRYSEKNNILIPMNGQPPSPPNTIPLITNGKRMVDPDAKRKKRLVKLHSRRKETIEPDENRDGLQLHPENLNLASNNDWPETSSGINNTTQTQKRRASKKQCKRNICTTKSAEDQNSVKALSSGTENDANHQQDCSSCLVSTQLTVINGEEIDTLGGNDDGKKMAPNTRSKRKKCMDMDKSCSLAPPIRSVEVRMDNESSVENRSFDTLASNKKSSALKQQHRKNKGTKPTAGVQDVVHISCQHNGPKKSKCRDVSCSDQHLATTDGEGITLACFLRSKSKKRKLDVTDCASAACPPLDNPKELESFSEGVAQPHVGNLAVTIMQDDGLTYCDNGVPESFLSCKINSSHSRDNPTIVATENEPCGVNLVREQNLGFHEPVREPASINMEDDHERDDVSLASFTKRKSKRKPQNAKGGGAKVRVPNNMLKGSKLPPERVDQFHDVNHTAFSASNSEPGGLDLVERHKVHEPEREQVSNGVEGDGDTGDITLASFLRHCKSGKRRLQSD